MVMPIRNTQLEMLGSFDVVRKTWSTNAKGKHAGQIYFCRVG